MRSDNQAQINTKLGLGIVQTRSSELYMDAVAYFQTALAHAPHSSEANQGQRELEELMRSIDPDIRDDSGMGGLQFT